MDVLNGIVKVLTEAMQEPGLMLGLVALLGLLLQKASIDRIVSETLKTILGMYILLAGVGLLLGSVGSLPTILSRGFAPDLVPPIEGSAADLIGTYGGAVAQAMLVAFVVNLILARLTPWKYVYLSGHIIFQNVIILMAIFITTVNLAIDFKAVLLIGAILGVYNTVMPALVQPFTRKVIGSNDFALAHSINVGVILSGWLGKYVGRPEQSTENIKFPSKLRFLSDPGIVAALIFMVVFALGAALAGPEYIQSSFAGNQTWYFWAFVESLKGAAGILVIFYGAKAMLAAIVPAFRGISKKLIPDAIPALDMPVFFGYAPTALIIGVVVHLGASLLSMVILGIAVPTAIVFPAMIATFFEGGTVGIFGNATGGVRGCVVGAFLVGILNMVGLATIIPLTRMVGDWMRILALSDYGTIYSAFAHLLNLAGR